MQPLPQSFYLQDTIQVAETLIGHRLVVSNPISGDVQTGWICETEAYLGYEDPACHSFHGKKTERTKTFYLPGGYSYVYLIYGMYFCFNVITGDEATPEAVLIRAVLPELGIESLKQRSPKTKHLWQLANGPGKLCRSFGITKKDNERPLFKESRIYIQDKAIDFDKGAIRSGSRIGIESYGDAAAWPLRFWVSPEEFQL